MKKLYIIFDQIPSKQSGGLVATYVSLANLLKDDYNIHIVSIFNCNEENKKQFDRNEIHIINNKNIDIRFCKVITYLKEGNIKKFFNAIFSAVYYFFNIPVTKYKIRKLINDNDKVIVTCPSAGIFMHKKIKFILEIHNDYKYFFGNNLLGKMQAKLMSKPTLTLFRTKDNAKKAPKHLNPNYIYNFFDNTNIIKNDKLAKNKIIYMGRLERQKNPLKLIDMAYELSKINNNFILDIYGNGSMIEQVKSKIKDLNLEDKVFYKGFTKDKNIYSNYSLLWLTSDSEGLPLNIIEAKANGIPTISTNWGNAVYEVINDKNDGYITNDDEEFVKLTNNVLTNSKLQKRLSDNAYKNFSKFSKEKAKKSWIKYLETYKDE